MHSNNMNVDRTGRQTHHLNVPSVAYLRVSSKGPILVCATDCDFSNVTFCLSLFGFYQVPRRASWLRAHIWHVATEGTCKPRAMRDGVCAKAWQLLQLILCMHYVCAGAYIGQYRGVTCGLLSSCPFWCCLYRLSQNAATPSCHVQGMCAPKVKLERLEKAKAAKAAAAAEAALPRLVRMLDYLLLETLVDTLETGLGVQWHYDPLQAQPCTLCDDLLHFA